MRGMQDGAHGLLVVRIHHRPAQEEDDDADTKRFATDAPRSMTVAGHVNGAQHHSSLWANEGNRRSAGHPRDSSIPGR